MTILPVPLLNQRTTTRSDGSRDPNADFDCVPESLSAGIECLTGTFVPGGVLKERVYGRSYQGGTAASAYIDMCAEYGVRLYALDADPRTLVADVHQKLAQGDPVVFTEPDPYAPSHPDWTHVCVFFKDEPVGTLSAMDPFGGWVNTQSDDTWVHTLLDHEIWIMEKLMPTLNINQVATYFEAIDDSHWRRKDRPEILLVLGMLHYYRSFGTAALSVLGLPLESEHSVLDGHGQPIANTAMQRFERGVPCYDPGHQVDAPPYAGDIYLLHIDNDGPGRDPRIGQVEQQLVAAQQAAKQMSGGTIGTACISAVRDIKTIVEKLAV